MRKKRSHISLSPMNPFTFYADMFKAGAHMAELYVSSAQVMAHRGTMIAQAMNGEIPLHHKEFNQMYQEKLLAGSESFAAGLKHLGSGDSAVNGFMEALAPYRKKASANAKRLRKKSKR